MLSNSLRQFNHSRTSLYLAILFFTLSAATAALWAVQEIAVFYFFVGYLICFAIAIIGTLVIQQKKWTGYSLWFHPPFLLSVWLLVGVFLPSIILYLDPSIPIHPVIDKLIYHPLYQYQGALIVVAGMASLWGAYLWGLNVFQPTILKPLFNRNITLSQPVVAITYLISLVAQIIIINIIGIGFGSDRTNLGFLAGVIQPLTYIANLYYLAITVYTYQTLKANWPSQGLYLMLLIQVILAFSSGFMKPLVSLFTVVFLAAVYAQAFSIKKAMLIGGLGTLLTIVVIPISEHIRGQFGLFDNRSLLAVLSIVQAGFTETWGQGFTVGWDIFVEKLLARQTALAHIPALVASRVPHLVPHLGWLQLLILPTLLIPRILWPSKPTIGTGGTWFSIHFFDAPLNTTTSTSPTLFGEAYLYAGFPAVIVIGIFLGFLLAYCYQSLTTTPIGMFIFISISYTFLEWEGRFSGILLGLIQLLFVYIAYLLIVIRLSKTSHKKQAPRFTPTPPKRL